MENDSVDRRRRRFLIAAASVVGGGGAAIVAIPFIQSLEPSAAATAPVDVDISKLEPGAMIAISWRGRPVWVLRRTEDQLKVLRTPAW